MGRRKNRFLSAVLETVMPCLNRCSIGKSCLLKITFVLLILTLLTTGFFPHHPKPSLAVLNTRDYISGDICDLFHYLKSSNLETSYLVPSLSRATPGDDLTTVLNITSFQKQDPEKHSFLDFPLEIRQKIYKLYIRDHILPRPDTRLLTAGSDEDPREVKVSDFAFTYRTALVHSCVQVRTEMTSMLWQGNALRLTRHPLTAYFAKGVATAAMSLTSLMVLDRQILSRFSDTIKGYIRHFVVLQAVVAYETPPPLKATMSAMVNFNWRAALDRMDQIHADNAAAIFAGSSQQIFVKRKELEFLQAARTPVRDATKLRRPVLISLFKRFTRSRQRIEAYLHNDMASGVAAGWKTSVEHSHLSGWVAKFNHSWLDQNDSFDDQVLFWSDWNRPLTKNQTRWLSSRDSGQTDSSLV